MNIKGIFSSVQKVYSVLSMITFQVTLCLILVSVTWNKTFILKIYILKIFPASKIIPYFIWSHDFVLQGDTEYDWM